MVTPSGKDTLPSSHPESLQNHRDNSGLCLMPAHQHQSLSMLPSLGGQKQSRSFTENANLQMEKAENNKLRWNWDPKLLGIPAQGNDPKPSTSKLPADQCDIRTTNHCPRFSLVILNVLNGNKIWKKAQGILQPSWTMSLVPSITTSICHCCPLPSPPVRGRAGHWKMGLETFGTVTKMTACCKKCKQHLAE